MWNVLSRLSADSWDQCDHSFACAFGSNVQYQRESTFFYVFYHPFKGCYKAKVVSEKRKNRSNEGDSWYFLICVFTMQRLSVFYALWRSNKILAGFLLSSLVWVSGCVEREVGDQAQIFLYVSPTLFHPLN